MPRPTSRPHSGGNTAGGRVAQMFDDENDKIEKKKKQGFMPFRFWLPNGEGCNVVILDASLEDGLAIREYNLQGSDGKYGNYERSFEDLGIECPIAKKYGAQSYLVLFLTVVAMKEWTSKKTGETHSYSKMLLPIKRGGFPKFRKLDAIAQKNNGSLRGAQVYMERGDGDQSFSIGEPTPNEDGEMLQYWTEEELLEEFGHPAIQSRDKKSVLKEENADTKIFDYLKLFPEPDIDDARKRHGVDPEPGSKADNAGDDFDDESGDKIPMSHKPSELGAAADGGDEEAIEKLSELAEKHGEEAEAYPDWLTLGKALDDLEAPTVKKAAKKAAKSAGRKRGPRKSVKTQGKTEDGGGDVDEW